MKKYSAFAVAREALRDHLGWERAWRSPEPQKKYDVIIIGAGGHGLATILPWQKLWHYKCGDSGEGPAGR